MAITVTYPVVPFATPTAPAWRSIDLQMSDGRFVSVGGATGGGITYQIREVTGLVAGSGTLGAVSESSPEAAGLKGTGGGFVIVDERKNSASDQDVMVHVATPTGTPVADFAVDATSANDFASDVVGLNDGGFAVTWLRTTAAGTGVWYAVYEADGSVRTPPTYLDPTTRNYYNQLSPPSITPLSTGGFAIAYKETDLLSLATFDDAGSRQLDLEDFVEGSEPLLTVLPHGELLVTYEVPYGALSGDGDPVWFGLEAWVIDAATGESLQQLVLETPTDTYGAGYEVRGYWIDGGAQWRDLDGAVSLQYRANVWYYYFNSPWCCDEYVHTIKQKQLVQHRQTTGDDLDNTVTGDDWWEIMYGRGGNDTLDGRGGNDRLDGGTGADTMRGGLGDDTYYVESTHDRLTELAGEGNDAVYTSINYTLGANLERLLANSGTGLRLNGNELDNTITGGGGDDILNGRGGADSLSGGAGNDTYCVDDHGDTVAEPLFGWSAGQDLVVASVAYQLPSYVENLTLTGDADLDGTGNNLANTITGNRGNNELDGGAGADLLQGGEGDDTYVVDNVGDVVKEFRGFGTDGVKASISYTLTNNVEGMRLMGTADISGTGNALANTITGNTGNNVLDGKAGADLLRGGEGDDTYIVDNLGDVVKEFADYGTDSVKASISHALAYNVENLTLTGVGLIDGTGNALANVIIGNGRANVLAGMAGNDILTGAWGADHFVFNWAFNDATNVDTITDFVAPADTIDLDDAIFTRAGPLGTLAADAFHIGTAAGDALDRIVYDAATGNLSYDRDGTGAAAAVLFAHLSPGLALTNADFLVV